MDGNHRGAITAVVLGFPSPFSLFLLRWLRNPQTGQERGSQRGHFYGPGSTRLAGIWLLAYGFVSEGAMVAADSTGRFTRTGPAERKSEKNGRRNPHEPGEDYGQRNDPITRTREIWNYAIMERGIRPNAIMCKGFASAPSSHVVYRQNAIYHLFDA
jgi:hypothetical protein